ncbi:MAG: serine hydrolase domain-containing protein [Reichenbachiella sp.]|uniref:serine hydrolase domain-containing protein n=1 Tax=Reichenbachiella sp. TaxID=2184521 RepID=UPI00329A414E
MKKALFLCGCLFFLFLWSSAQDSLNTFSNQLKQYEENDEFNGVIAIAMEGKVFFHRGIGFANFEDQIKNDRSMPMPISSITKPFTAVAIMLLVERQLMDYKDQVSKHIENFPYQNITIQHLLNHTSGFKRSYKDDLSTTDEILNYVINKKPKLSFEPGDKFQYSNLGYSLLAAIVEKVSGKPFDRFLSEEIFKPLSMNNTFLLTEENAKIPKANSYDKNGNLTAWHLDSYPGAKGIYASANDLLKWDQALYGEQLVSQETISKSYTSGTLNDGSTINYGYGWRKWNGNEHLIFHAGDWVGNESILFRDLDRKMTIIIMANRENEISKWQLMDQILAILDYDN